MERIRKDLFAAFRREGLKITVSPPSTSVDFLDLTLRSDGNKICKPPVKQPTVHNIPEMIADRINSIISSCKEVFDDAKPYCKDALKSSGYMESCMTYNTQAKPPRNRRKKRKVLWFNPPFCHCGDQCWTEIPQFVGETLPSGQSTTQDLRPEQCKSLI